jgi:hypothetical protein
LVVLDELGKDALGYFNAINTTFVKVHDFV